MALSVTNMPDPIANTYASYPCTEPHCRQQAFLPVTAPIAPVICRACWFWIAFRQAPSPVTDRIIANGVLYDVDLRDDAEHVGPVCVVRYFDGRSLRTTRLRTIGIVPFETADTAIVMQVPRTIMRGTV